jgi:hypothetical protein
MKFRIIKSIYWEGPKPFPKEKRMFLKKEKIYQFLMDYEENSSFCSEFPKALIVTTIPIVLIILYLTGTGKLFFVAVILSLLLIAMPILIFVLKSKMVKKYLEKHFSKDIADFTWLYTEYYNTPFYFFTEDVRRDMEKFPKGKERDKIMVAGLDYWFNQKARNRMKYFEDGEKQYKENKSEQLENIIKKYRY